MGIMKKLPLLTVPNALTFLRALGIPLFIYLAISLEADGWAILTLAIGGATDYFDGKIARALNQESELGAVLDPTIDRAYIAATAVALVIKEIIPLWLLLLLISRDLWLGLMLLVKRRQGTGVFEVTFLGKAATFNLLYAFPFLLLSDRTGVGEIFHICGWAFAIWGGALYLATGAQYTIFALVNTRK